MGYLYVLTEDDNDNVFFKRCVERLTGKAFTVDGKKYRKDGGKAAFRRALPRFLKSIKYLPGDTNSFFLVATDNDRAPIYPDCTPRTGLTPKELAQRCGYQDVLDRIEHEFGPDRANWPIPGAIAVPVEMMESWLLLICGYPSQNDLPLFSSREDAIAKQYYAKHHSRLPSLQLKDLSEAERKMLNISNKSAFYTHCVDNLDPDVLAAKSPSFALFREEVAQWAEQT